MMAVQTIGLLHPGEMGSAVGLAARTAGNRVLWTSEGRGSRTRRYAESAGLEDAGPLSSLVQQSEVILSVCPPHAAADVARSVASLDFRGLYVDANAVSPETTREIGGIVERGGATFIDGGIIGLPPVKPGDTRLYMSGPGAEQIVPLFKGSLLEAIALDAPVGAASALKMSYAIWTKGTSALILAIRALAASENVDQALVAEWARSMPDLLPRCERAVNQNARKAWRFVGEMEEIAETFAGAGLPDGFALAAREIYHRLERYKDAATPPSIEEVIDVVWREREKALTGARASIPGRS